MNGERCEGRLIRFDDVAGYGFIEHPDGGADVFFHVNDLAHDVKHGIRVGRLLGFEIMDGDRGPKAVDVDLLGDDDEVSTAEFRSELTDVLIGAMPGAAVGDLANAREAVLGLVRSNGWID